MAERGSGLDWGREVPFVTHLGFTLLQWDEHGAEIAYEARPEHLNSLGITHGGACMTLLDVALARAARGSAQDLSVVTVELKTTFLRPAKGPLRARAQLLHRTDSLAFVEGRILDAHERTCAHATGTFRYVRRHAPAAPQPGGSD